MGAALELTRSQILAFRRRVGSLDERLPDDPTSLRQAAWAGLQDSMPRAALLSLHARVDGTGPATLEEPSLVQVWGPRFSVYVIAAADIGVFTLGRMPVSGTKRDRALELAEGLRDHLGDGQAPYGEVGRALGVHPNALRYAAPTGTVLIEWDGARQPVVRTASPPDTDAEEARLELARRYLHVFGPATPEGFAKWAGVTKSAATATLDALAEGLIPVRTPIGDAWILTRDEEGFREDTAPPAAARLLPSGDAYYLLWGSDRDLVVEDPARRDALWTSRVWPGAVLVDGEIVGIWRRTQHEVTVDPWGRVSRAQKDAVESEATSLPLPGVDRDIVVRWEGV